MLRVGTSHTHSSQQHKPEITVQISCRRECLGRLYRATFLTLPRAFFLFLAEARTLVPFLCANFLPLDRPEAVAFTMRTRRFSLVFDTPSSFAVSSAVAKTDSRTMVIFILSSYDTLPYPKKLGGRFFS